MKLLSVLGLFCLTTYVLFAQNPTQSVRGVVRDAANRETLPGASLMLRKLERGTITDMEGQFLFSEVPVGRYTLEVRFVGYEPVVVPEITDHGHIILWPVFPHRRFYHHLLQLGNSFRFR